MEHTKRNAAAYNAHAQDWATHTARNEKYRFLEKPAMEALVPENLTGKRVLCIGVGSGEELDVILARNPLKVVAIDTSQKLLDIAQERFPEVECVCIDMMALGSSTRHQARHPRGCEDPGGSRATPDSSQQENATGTLSKNSFDLIYSSLAFHYANDWDILLAGIYRTLKPNGTLLFSAHHPDYWAKNQTGGSHTNERGVKLTEHQATLAGGAEIIYFNHPNTDSIHDALEHTGFTVERAFAPDVVSVPPHTLTPALCKRYENLVRTNQKTPLFWVVRASLQADSTKGA